MLPVFPAPCGWPSPWCRWFQSWSRPVSQNEPARRSSRRSVLPHLEVLEDRTVPAAFKAGDLVIYRVGDGGSGLQNTGAKVFLDEYQTDGTLVQSIALPSAASGTQKQLIASGTAQSEGLLTRSADGRFLLLTGYAADLGGTTDLAGTSGSAVNRT